MDTGRTIDRAGWTAFFNTLSGMLSGRRVEVETASLDIGDQVVAEWLPLVGITYDDHDDLVDVALGELDHLIHQPRAVRVQEGAQGIETIAIEAADATNVLRLRTPLMLPAPAASGSGRAKSK
jgi:hypothetical protein